MTGYQRLLAREQQQYTLKARLNITSTSFFKPDNDELRLMPCNNLYDALSFSYTGSTGFSDTFRTEILNFMKYAWVNPDLAKKLEQEGKTSLSEYVARQQSRFTPYSTSDFLELKAAATFLQVTIWLLVPEIDDKKPSFVIRPLITNLKMSENDYVNTNAIIMLGAVIVRKNMYRFEAIKSYPRLRVTKKTDLVIRKKMSYSDDSDNLFEYLKDVFLESDRKNIAMVCMLMGLPKHKCLAARRRNMKEDDVLEQLFCEWYSVAKGICEESAVDASVMLGRAFLLTNDLTSFHAAVPSLPVQQYIKKSPKSFNSIAEKIQQHFQVAVKPMMNR